MLNPFAPAWVSRGNGANQAISLTSTLHPHEPELLSSNIHNMVVVGYQTRLFPLIKETIQTRSKIQSRFS
jgi:hypothetical protein